MWHNNPGISRISRVCVKETLEIILVMSNGQYPSTLQPAASRRGRCCATGEVFIDALIVLCTPRHRSYLYLGMDQYLLIPFLGGMNIHLPAILMFTRGTRFWPTAIYSCHFYKSFPDISDIKNLVDWHSWHRVSEVSKSHPHHMCLDQVRHVLRSDLLSSKPVQQMVWEWSGWLWDPWQAPLGIPLCIPVSFQVSAPSSCRINAA